MAVSFRRSSLWLTILFPQSQTSLSEVISLCDVKLQKANYQYSVISVTERWNSTFEYSNWKEILAPRNGRDYTWKHTGKPNLNFQPNQLSQYIPELFRADGTNDISLRVLMFRQLIPTNVLPISHRLFCQSMNAFHNYCCKFFMLFLVVFHSYDWPPWNVRQTFTTCRRNTIWIDGFFRIWLVFLLLRRVKKKRSSIQFIDPSQNANQLSLKMKKYVYLNEMAISFIFQFIQLVQSELDTHRNKKDSVVLSQCDLFRKNKFDIA